MRTILVVGAGPVGLTMAAELARYGLSVRIIDRSAQASQTSKALVVWSRTLELMDRMGCTGAFLDAGLHAHAASIRDSRKILGHTRFDAIASAYNFALMIPQRDTERLLAAHLRALGVDVERQVELVAFTERDGSVEASLRHADGREEAIETPWLIGCDGAHSTVRHGLRFAFEGEAQGDDWLLADVRLAGDHAPAPDEIATYLHSEGPFVVFPMPGGRARVIATIGKTDPARPRPDPTLADVQAMVDRRAGGGFRADDPVWLANFRINERKVSDYRRGHVFLAGDAAHVHSPAGGQGMNTGMQDAIALAWRLALVSRGQAAASLLDSYSPERSLVGDLVLRNATRLTDMVTLSNPLAQGARNIAIHVLLGLHAVQGAMADTMSETKIAYAKSALSQGSGAGRRLDPAHYDGPAPGAGADPLFVLHAADRARGDALAARFPGLLQPASRRPPTLREMLIVRPDGYIGLSCDATGWDEADRYLEGLRPLAA